MATSVNIYGETINRENSGNLISFINLFGVIETNYFFRVVINFNNTCLRTERTLEEGA